MTGGHRAGSQPPPLDWVDMLIHVAITICFAFVVAIAMDGGGAPPEIGAFGVIAASLAVLAWRRGRARGAVPRSSADEGRLAELEERLAHLELSQERVLELEERLDFAERLLTQQRQPDRLEQP